MPSAVRKTLITVAALGAVAAGSSAIAGAAGNGSSSSTTASEQQRSGGTRDGPGGRGGRSDEKALTGDTASKVKAAAEAKVSGGTVLRVETDADHGSPYEAHVRKSDGTEVEVLVNKDYSVTAVNAMHRP